MKSTVIILLSMFLTIPALTAGEASGNGLASIEVGELTQDTYKNVTLINIDNDKILILLDFNSSENEIFTEDLIIIKTNVSVIDEINNASTDIKYDFSGYGLSGDWVPVVLDDLQG